MLAGTPWPQNLHISREGAEHKDKVFALVRKMYGCGPNDEMEEFDVNGAIW